MLLPWVYVAKDSDIQNLDDLKDAILGRDVVMACNNRADRPGNWNILHLRMAATSRQSFMTVGPPHCKSFCRRTCGSNRTGSSDGQEYVKSGDLRPIAAVLDPNRLTSGDIYKDVPTSKEQGYEWLTNGFFHGYAAPKGSVR